MTGVLHFVSLSRWVLSLPDTYARDRWRSDLKPHKLCMYDLLTIILLEANKD